MSSSTGGRVGPFQNRRPAATQQACTLDPTTKSGEGEAERERSPGQDSIESRSAEPAPG
jgi:hypothetical protein